MQLESRRQILRIMQENPKIEITAHRYPGYVGQLRRVTLSDKEGFYSVVDGQPEHELSRRHRGKGSYTYIGNRRFLKLDGDICTVYSRTREPEGKELLLSFRIIDNK